MSLNEYLFFVMHNLASRSPFFDSIIIFFAEYAQYIVILGVIGFLLVHRDTIESHTPFEIVYVRAKEILSFFTSALVALFSVKILKIVFSFPRPYLLYSTATPLFSAGLLDSFPSGHATFFSALATTMTMYHRRAGIFLWIISFCIILSRIIAGVHTPVDCIAGVILGSVIAYFFTLTFSRNRLPKH